MKPIGPAPPSLLSLGNENAMTVSQVSLFTTLARHTNLVHVCVSHTHAGTCRTWTFGGKRGVGANQSICHHEERHTDTSSTITQAEIQQCLICVSSCLRQQKQYSNGITTGLVVFITEGLRGQMWKENGHTWAYTLHTVA